MKIFKVLKHSKKDSIHILDEKQNHQYILSILAVTMMAYQDELKGIVIASTKFNTRIPRKYAQVKNTDLIDIVMENDIEFHEKISLIQEYCVLLNENFKTPINFIESINVIKSMTTNPLSGNTIRVDNNGRISGFDTIRSSDINSAVIHPRVTLTEQLVLGPRPLDKNKEETPKPRINGSWVTHPGVVGAGGWTSR